MIKDELENGKQYYSLPNYFIDKPENRHVVCHNEKVVTGGYKLCQNGVLL